MIVVGIGCRKGATAAQVTWAIHHALEQHGLHLADLGLLLTGEIKRDETGIAEAASAMGLPLMVLDDGRLRTAASACLTSSSASIEISGVPSLSEAAAIVGAGNGGRLLGPRLATDGVTCALATTQWSSVAAHPEARG